ncbi:MAG TPA: sugar ABC transporter permease [Fimbriimonadaceae bacterium]|nr:sugar ABC transporter permease [Fimbriimonadaceae bacterium]
MTAERNRPLIAWAFIGPAFAHLLIFALIPMAYALYVSFYKVQLLRDEWAFTGLGNYALAVAEPPFWNAMWNSFRYALMSVPAGMFVALLIAILVNQKLRGMTIFRTLYYIPAISSGVAVAMLWTYVFLPDTGLINTMLLGLFGPDTFIGERVLRGVGVAPYPGIDFLNRSEWAMPALAFMSIWVGLGPRMILFLAGLIGIPQSLYEAAQLDGAGKLRSFWNVTLPMLVPTTFFVLITSTIGAMQIFTPVYMMTKGGPEDTTDVVGYHIYTEAWVNFNTGIASAKSFVLLAVIVVISLFQFRLMRNQMQGYSSV